VEQLLQQERAAAERVWGVFEEALTASLDALEIVT
jgi:hypothetical protein